MKNKFKLAVILFSILILLNCSCSPVQNKTPNVLLITADDLGLHLSCYGDTVIQTPHIDGLANEGIRFTNGYVSQASCSPSRSTIYTGLFPHQNGQLGLSHLGFAMLDNLPNIVSILKQHGYRTGIIGKLHIQPAGDFPFDYKNTPAEPTRDVFNVANQAEEFFLSGDAPFFLAVNYFDPHVQFADQVKGIPEKPLGAEDVTMFDFQRISTPAQRERIAGYYNGIKRLDAGVGMLIEKLQSLNLLDNTFVIFVSDNGAPFTRSKTSCYEAALKIPIIVKYPGDIPGNTVSSALVSTTDILPTVLDVCNIEFNHSSGGKSLVPLFNHPDESFRKFLFAEFNFHVGLDGFFPRRSIRDETYKLIHNLRPGVMNHILEVDGDSAYFYAQQEAYAGTLMRKLFERYAQPPEFELYNLEEDPHEYKNLADDPVYEEVLITLKNELYDWQKRTHDPLLYDFFWDKFEYVPGKKDTNP